jgi:hypothetical protein
VTESQKSKAALMGEKCRTIIKGMRPEWAMPMRIVALDTRLSISAVRRSMKLLKGLGLVDLGPIFNEDDGLIYGSGYALTMEGENMRDFLLEGDL